MPERASPERACSGLCAVEPPGRPGAVWASIERDTSRTNNTSASVRTRSVFVCSSTGWAAASPMSALATRSASSRIASPRLEGSDTPSAPPRRARRQTRSSAASGTTNASASNTADRRQKCQRVTQYPCRGPGACALGAAPARRRVGSAARLGDLHASCPLQSELEVELGLVVLWVEREGEPEVQHCRLHRRRRILRLGREPREAEDAEQTRGTRTSGGRLVA